MDSRDHQHNQPALGLTETATVPHVDEFTFPEPIRGYPTLQWQGKHPLRSIQYYPAQHKETHGPEVEGWRNQLYWGDNLQVMSHLLKRYRGQVQLIYIDPPFDSKADYTRKISVRGQSASSDKSAFEDKQYTDIWTNDEYLQFMYERLILMRELLADEGSIYVHCDWHRSHFLRCMLDEIFGLDTFINNITWKRTTAHGDAKQGARHFDVVDDTILFYSKSATRYRWNTQYAAFSSEQIRQQYNKMENGRLYRLVTPTAAKPGGDTSYEWRGVRPPEGRYWAYSRDKMAALDQEGRLYYSSTGQPYIKYYLDERPGVALSTIWTDIMLAPTSLERVDYPTQKPEALLERIICASSNPGDLVCDCFMGSGTTQAVATKLGRRFLGADINLGAIQITTRRLIAVATDLQAQVQRQAQPAQPQLLAPAPAEAGEDEEDEEGTGEGASARETQPTTFYTGFEVYNVNNYDVFRNPVQARDLLIEALELNPLPADSLFDGERDGRMWKIMPVNRIATAHDLTELINNFDYKAFQRAFAEAPNKPVERLTLVCMGHEPNLAALLQDAVAPFKLDVVALDILRDRDNLQFRRDSEAQIVLRDGELIIEAFYPMTLLSKLSQQRDDVTEWRELVDSVMIDWNYDGAILEPVVVDVPAEGELVRGRYPVPPTAGTIRVKITDLLSDSLEMEVRADA